MKNQLLRYGILAVLLSALPFVAMAEKETLKKDVSTNECSQTINFTGNVSILGVLLRQNNWLATADPTANDDSADGYEAGSIWLNTVGKKVWICTDATEGAATWSLNSTPTFTADRVVITDGAGSLSVSSVTSNVLTYLDISSSLTTLLSGKVGTSGDETVAGKKTFSTFPETPSSAPSTDYQVANKKYVDDNGGGAGSDTTAIHDNENGEIAAVTEKAAPVSGDILIAEDSEATNAKKRVQMGNMAKAVLPSDTGHPSEFLQADGSGNFSWTAPPSGGTTADTDISDTNNSSTTESPSIRATAAYVDGLVRWQDRPENLGESDSGKPLVAYIGSGGIDGDTKLMLHLNNNVTDSSASAHTVTNVSSGVTFSSSGGISGYSEYGAFDGSTSYLTVPDSSDFTFGTNNFSIDMWVYRNGTGNDERLFSHTSTSNDDYNVELWISSSNYLCFLYSTAGDGSTWDNADDYEGDTYSIPATTWTHIAIVRNGATITSYVNGNAESSWNVGAASIHNSASEVWIGSSHYGPNTFNLVGRIDELRVTNGTARWTTDFTPPSAPYSSAATYFTPSATLSHEFGGLEADVSAYSGLVKISGGATSAATIGIADNNIVEIDSADVGTGEYAKFTANGLEGKTASEVKTDLSLNNVENTAISTATTIGTITSGGLGTGATLGAVTVNIASSASGDMYYAGGSNVLTRLAKGTALQVLRMNAGATAPEWAAASGITGPGSSTDNTIPRWNGTGGDTLQGSTVYIDDNNNLSTGASTNSLYKIYSYQAAKTDDSSALQASHVGDFAGDNHNHYGIRSVITSAKGIHTGTANKAIFSSASGADSNYCFWGDDGNMYLADRFGIGRAPTSELDVYKASGNCRVLATTAAAGNGEYAIFSGTAKKSGGSGRGASIGCYYNSGSTSNEACGILIMSAGDGVQNYLWVSDSDTLMISTSSANIGTATGTVVGDQTSDIRKKKDISDSAYGLTEILKLKPIKYKLKDDPRNEFRIGFSAQDVQAVVPEAVYDSKDKLSADSDETKLVMRPYELIPVLVSAIQEQQAQIDNLKKRIEALEKK